MLTTIATLHPYTTDATLHPPIHPPAVSSDRVVSLSPLLQSTLSAAGPNTPRHTGAGAGAAAGMEVVEGADATVDVTPGVMITAAAGAAAGLQPGAGPGKGSVFRYDLIVLVRPRHGQL